MEDVSTLENVSEYTDTVVTGRPKVSFPNEVVAIGVDLGVDIVSLEGVTGRPDTVDCTVLESNGVADADFVSTILTVNTVPLTVSVDPGVETSGTDVEVMLAIAVLLNVLDDKDDGNVVADVEDVTTGVIGGLKVVVADVDVDLPDTEEMAGSAVVSLTGNIAVDVKPDVDRVNFSDPKPDVDCSVLLTIVEGSTDSVYMSLTEDVDNGE